MSTDLDALLKLQDDGVIIHGLNVRLSEVWPSIGALDVRRRGSGERGGFRVYYDGGFGSG